MPHIGPKRFSYRYSDSGEEFCYPFHAACWSIIHEIDHESFSNGFDGLFNILESAHYVREGSRCLNWGQDLYLQELYDKVPEEADLLESANPSISFESLQTPISCLARSDNVSFNTLRGRISHTSACEARGLLSLPVEILESIFCILNYADVQCLLKSSPELYKLYGCGLPDTFWKSRFWIFNETAFAGSIRPSSCSFQDWYFSITSALRKGPYRLNLLNRKRIWKIGLDLISTIRALSNSDRRLHGHDFIPPANLQSPTATCTAKKYSFGTCRELKQVYVSFGDRHLGSRLCDVNPSYILISGRRLISGLTFRLSDGMIYHVGYVTKSNIDHTSWLAASTTASRYLWLVCSHFGLEATKLDGIGQPHLDHSTSTPGSLTAVTRWPLVDSIGVSIGLDVCVASLLA